MFDEKCPNCNNKMDFAEDIDHIFRGEDTKWFCILISWYCPSCNYMTVMIKGDEE